jgi:hypothetical protein
MCLQPGCEETFKQWTKTRKHIFKCRREGFQGNPKMKDSAEKAARYSMGEGAEWEKERRVERSEFLPFPSEEVCRTRFNELGIEGEYARLF